MSVADLYRNRGVNPLAVQTEPARDILHSVFFNDANLVAYWRLEGDVTDSKGENDGTENGLVYSASYGKFGHGAMFNGLNSSFYSQSASFDFDGADPFTFSLWIRPVLPAATKYNVLMCIQEGSNDRFRDKQLELYADGSICLEAWDGSSPAQERSLSSAGVILTGLLYWVVVTFDATNLLTYVNGALEGTEGFTNTYNLTAPRMVMSSKDSGLANNLLYCGTMDDIAVFSRALTATEIANYYAWATA